MSYSKEQKLKDLNTAANGIKIAFIFGVPLMIGGFILPFVFDNFPYQIFIVIGLALLIFAMINAAMILGPIALGEWREELEDNIVEKLKNREERD